MGRFHMYSSLSQAEKLEHIDTLQLVLNVLPKAIFMLLKEQIEVTMLGYLFLQVGHKVVVLVEELGVLIDLLGSPVDVFKVTLFITVVLYERLVLWLVDSHLYDGVG